MPENAHPAVFLETFGCQMNVLDSELVTSSLRSLGYRFVDDTEAADVILYNTCSVRQHAEEKVFGRLGLLRRVKQRRPGLVIGVLGCMAECHGDKLFDRFAHLDLICGPGELDKLPVLLDNATRTRTHASALGGNNNRRSATLAAAQDSLEQLDLARAFSPDEHRASAYVRITRGCNKFCTYCVVPYTRGAEVHRPPDHIVDECRRLADAGVIEVTLLGQTVNHYRYDHGASVTINGIQQPQVGPGLGAFRRTDEAGQRLTSFADLLHRIHEQVPAIRRLRFVTSYPRDFGDEVLQVMADSPRICRYLHVPAQSGSDRMLKAMNRGYTVGEYRQFIDRVRHHLPDAMIAGDFIVGFPGETEEDFQQSIDLLRYCRYKNSFIFKYSPRPGTPAYDRLPDDVSDEIKRRRNNELLAVQAEIGRQVHAEQVGRVFEVFVEGLSTRARKQQGRVEIGWEPQITQLSGRTMGDLIVMFDGDPSLIGRIVRVRIEDAQPLTLFGRLVDQPAADLPATAPR